jgi:hypothetical protein
MNTENQTQFMEDQLLWQEQQPTSVSPVMNNAQELPVKPPMSKVKKIGLIAVAVFGALLLLMIVLMMTMGVGEGGLSLLPAQPSPTPSAQHLGEFDQAFKLLQQDIQAADPSINEFPYPPVSKQLFIVEQ